MINRLRSVRKTRVDRSFPAASLANRLPDLSADRMSSLSFFERLGVILATYHRNRSIM